MIFKKFKVDVPKLTEIVNQLVEEKIMREKELNVESKGYRPSYHSDVLVHELDKKVRRLMLPVAKDVLMYELLEYSFRAHMVQENVGVNWHTDGIDAPEFEGKTVDQFLIWLPTGEFEGSEFELKDFKTGESQIVVPEPGLGLVFEGRNQDIMHRRRPMKSGKPIATITGMLGCRWKG